MPSLLLDAAGMKRTLGRMAHEILELNGGSENLVVVGILRRGYPVAKRLAFTMTQIEGVTIPCGKIDVRSSRDDRPTTAGEDQSEIPFEVEGKTVILVDEVIFTGRTIRAALDVLLKFGRPACVRLAVLADRGHRELPIEPNTVGKVIDTERGDHVEVRLQEFDGDDAVILVRADEREAASR
ncbi:MAG: bifunctional pyr operon transcriptional regulator/uracil phosphoribosyltransferase PyrR [Fimbriimonadaceae bacterium]|nr:MAG: bifunctional pyr operon transcriptional regulator/uracil phosphoribosyltransferase PyrR [Fimbriimonadaceae bacterium]